MIYHIVPQTEWKKAKTAGTYAPESLKTDGFIHCSNRYQLWLVATFLYKGRDDLIILYIDENLVEAKLRYEDLKRHGEFPHIYGPLNINSVVKTESFILDEYEDFILPKDV